MLDGLLVINKPSGWTSFDVVAKIRGKLKVKKIGHTGTLDPMATGVLVLCLGKATKLAQEITGTDKEYVAEITLGATSTTDDLEGQISFGNSELAMSYRHDVKNQNSKSNIEPKTTNLGLEFRTLSFQTPSLSKIEQTLKKFTGVINQVPPQFSAKKVKGQRAYKLARKGKEVELKPVMIIIHELELIDYKWPVIKVRVLCGKGTYIRSLARDIGKELGVGGYLSKLERTKVGRYSIDQSVSVEGASQDNIIPITE